MELGTQDYLRKAVINALSEKNDTAAFELLSLLHGTPHQKPAVSALPPAQDPIDGPPHAIHYWTNFARQNFIPFLQVNGRCSFTSYQMFDWIEHSGLVTFTTGDMEKYPDGKKYVWRNIASNALQHMKKQGIIDAPAWSKTYTIKVSSPTQGLLVGT